MRKHTKKNKISGLNSQLTLSFQNREPGIRPNTTAPLSTNSLQNWKSKQMEKTFSLSIVSHITIYSKVELSRKRVSLLLEQSILRVNSEGFSIQDYFCFEWMFNYLVGSGSLETVNGKKMSMIVYLTYLILKTYQKNENLLYEKTSLNSELSSWISENLGTLNDRKYQGRNSLYRIDKFLLFRIENVETIFERSQNSIRYSSYCKGYGESGRSVRKQKTRFSYELDRDDSENKPEEFYSFWNEIHYQEDLFYLEQQLRKERKA
jgi:hypothetical protein